MKPGIELRHLRYFLALAEALHFTRAAARLGIAPPTLSVQIRELEAFLAAELFRRAQRSVRLTPAGEAFRAEAQATVEQFERTESVGRRAGRGELGRIELGYVGSAAYGGVLQDQVARFRADHPAVELICREHPMEAMPRMLDEGRLDIAFIRPPLPLPPGLRSHVLLRDFFCLALPEAHPLAAGDGAVAGRALAKEDFLLPEQALGTEAVGRRGRFVPRILGRPGSLKEVLTAVSLGHGLAVVPSVLVAVVRLPGIRFRALGGAAIASEIAAAFRRHERSPAARLLIRQIAGTPERQAAPL